MSKKKGILITADEMCPEGVQALCAAIVKRAVMDYAKSFEAGDRYDRRQFEAFFRSGWYKMLTNIDGDAIIRHVRRNHKKMKRLKEC